MRALGLGACVTDTRPVRALGLSRGRRACVTDTRPVRALGLGTCVTDTRPMRALGLSSRAAGLGGGGGGGGGGLRSDGRDSRRGRVSSTVFARRVLCCRTRRAKHARNAALTKSEGDKAEHMVMKQSHQFSSSLADGVLRRSGGGTDGGQHAGGAVRKLVGKAARGSRIQEGGIRRELVGGKDAGGKVAGQAGPIKRGRGRGEGDHVGRAPSAFTPEAHRGGVGVLRDEAEVSGVFHPQLQVKVHVTAGRLAGGGRLLLLLLLLLRRALQDADRGAVGDAGGCRGEFGREVHAGGLLERGGPLRGRGLAHASRDIMPRVLGGSGELGGFWVGQRVMGSGKIRWLAQRALLALREPEKREEGVLDGAEHVGQRARGQGVLVRAQEDLEDEGGLLVQQVEAALGGKQVHGGSEGSGGPWEGCVCVLHWGKGKEGANFLLSTK
ncbi:MAG: hypothetical protein CML13_09575 [Puniceicoccaceae bacterium]|nr:hypothetical protein [Puniceicoccaceae bacterium]